MAALTQADKAEKFDKIQAKQRLVKLEGKVWRLRITEAGTAAAASTGLGMLAAYKPDSDGWFYGLGSPKVVATALGIGTFLLSGKSDYARELGAGMMFAGGVPLMHKLGAYLFSKIST